MNDFANLWTLIKYFLDIRFELYGFVLSWGSILVYSLFGSLVFGALIMFFKSHE